MNYMMLYTFTGIIREEDFILVGIILFGVPIFALIVFGADWLIEKLKGKS